MNVVSIDQVKMGVKRYIDFEIGRKASGFAKFAVYFMQPSIEKEMQSLIDSAKTNPWMSEFFHENGNILIDEVYKRALQAADMSGKVVIEKFGLSMDRSDVEKLYNYIMGV